MNMEQLNTGTLRARLQPVVFATLTADIAGTPARAGDHVGLQYWGNGDVAVTANPRLTGAPYAIAVKAHDVHAAVPALNSTESGT